MAIKNVSQTVPDTALEHLLSEIASVAYLTESRPDKILGHTTDLLEQEVTMLLNTIARMGWMADIALSRIESDNCLRQGKAEAWLLPRNVFESLDQEVQS